MTEKLDTRPGPGHLPLAWFVFATVAAALSSCGGSNNSPTASPPALSTPPPSSPPTPIASPAPTPLATPVATAEPTPTGPPPNTPLSLSLVAAFSQLPPLDGSDPQNESARNVGLVGLFQAPGDPDHWYALLRSGRIMRFENRDDVTAVDTFLDISAITATASELGLLGLAFHPEFADNGEFFLHYSDNRNGGASTIARFRFDGTLPASPQSEEPILVVAQPANNHNGGSIAFGPDGYLYIAFGDGGGGGDPFANGQNTQTLLGAMLRIDVDNSSPYDIPSDNPFVGNSDVAPEIFAYGLRNPWRWSFDMQSGDIWLADVGQNAYEEIDRVNPGDNLGWPIMEASHCYRSETCAREGLTLPVWEYPIAGVTACSRAGGYVYRAESIPELQGQYIYSDFCSGEVMRLIPEATGYRNASMGGVPDSEQVAALGQGLAGEVFILAFGSGKIFRIEAAQ